jgi:very-long-chain enoyl-CoA reductase
MPPRVHNIVSYKGALLVFWGVLAWRAQGLGGLPFTAGLAAALWSLHFVRRIWESAFVHRYSKAQIGPGDYLTEYVYYWGFGAWIAWSVTAPAQHTPLVSLRVLGLALFFLAEAGNARAHRVLRELRAPGGRERQIPRGLLFQRLSCPHYLFEILSWLGFNLVTQTWAGLAFMLVGAGILGAWAHTRHAAYRKEFDGQDGRDKYPDERRALIPFVF